MTSQNPTTDSQTYPRAITIDAEHFAIRFLVPVLILGLILGLHIFGTPVLRDIFDGVQPLCIVLPLDLAILLGGGFVIERILKTLLPSRRSAVLSEDALVVTDARRNPPDERTFYWGRTLNVKAWRFTVRRRTRIPKGWYCMAIQLLQDETETIMYTFMPPDEAENIQGFDNFVRLRPRKETQSNTDLSAVAEQRRLLRLEDTRWNEGAELSRDDFLAVLQTVQRRIPGWF